MDFRCCQVKNCSKSSVLGDLFSSPQEPAILRQWQRAIGTNQSQFFVCERHFTKKDIIVEKNLQDTAVPKLHLTGVSFKLENNCCGLCLDDLNEPHQISRESRNYFTEISGYEPLTDLMCRECKFTLISLKKFQTELPVKHANIRNLINAQLIEIKPDSMVVENDIFPKIDCYPCEYCTAIKTIDEKKLKEHIKEKHSFQCDECRFYCSRAKELETHMIHGHKTRENHQCLICGLKGFINTAMLNIHQEQLHHINKFSCCFCDQVFGSAVDLRVHIAYLHPFSKRAAYKKQANVIATKRLTPLGIRKIIPKNIRQVQSNFKKLPQKQFAVKKILPVSHEKLIEVKLEPNTDEIEELAVVKEEPELTINPTSSSIMNRNDVESIFVEQLPEIIEQPIKLEIVSHEERSDPISYWDVNSKTSPFDNSVKCLDCNHTMRFEDLMAHRLTEHSKTMLEPTSSSKVLNTDDDLVFIEDLPEFIEPKMEENLNNGKRTDRPLLDNMVRCLDCQKVMGVEELLAHRLKEHPESDEEAKTYPRMPTPPFASKKVKKHRNRVVSCEFCSVKLLQDSLKNHIDRFHSDTPNAYLCHVCSKSFYKEHVLKRHLKVHDPESKLCCDKCGGLFISKNRIRSHLYRYHLNTIIYKAQCKICLKRVTQKFSEHMETYHKDGYDCGARANNETNFFDCYKCGASYINLHTYRRHDCVKGRFQIRCNDCQVPIKSVENLETHKRSNMCQQQKWTFLRESKI